MAEARSNVQFPLGGFAAKSVIQAEMEAFQEGIELGKQYAQVAARKLAAYAEENPGTMLLIGLASGFLVGKMLFRPPRRIPEVDF